MANYVPYHMHTEYSLLDSCDKPETYIQLAVENGMKALAFTEHGNIYNWTDKYMKCKEAGIKYIHGVEVYMTETLDEKIRDNFHTVLLARNYEGVLEINKLVSQSYEKDHFHYKNRITFEEFLNLSDNVIKTSACLGGPLNKLNQDNPWFEKLLKKYDFLEVQYHSCQEQIDYNKRLKELSDQYGIPLIAGTDTHCSSEYKAECRRILLASKKIKFSNEDSFDLVFKTYEQLVQAFKDQGSLSEEDYLQAIENTNLLYDMVEDFELDLSIKYPISYGSAEEDAFKLREICRDMFIDKIKNRVIPVSQKDAFGQAIKEELEVFEKLGMSGFMLSMSELMQFIKGNGLMAGYARGSVGGSRVAYVTDIIDLNPETWNTVFSRFCNEDRVEVGD